MQPIAYFDALWLRCAQLSAVHAYLANNVVGALQPEEILRAEWVSRLCALDLYIHELVAQRMVETFEGKRAPSQGYLRFQISSDTLHRIRSASSPADASAAFDLEVRERLSYLTYQDPERIAEGVRLFSAVELWNEVAVQLGATAATKVEEARSLKKQLSVVVRRRNQIAHEGDLQPGSPRLPWPISQADLKSVAELVEKVVKGVDAVAV